MYGSVRAIDFQRGLDDAWSSVATFVPRLALFLLILAVGWFVAKALARFASAALRKVGFDRAVERSGAARLLEGSDYDATRLIAQLLYYFVLLIVLQAAFGVFGPNPISDALNSVVRWLPKAAVAVIIVVVVGAIANAVRDILTGVLSAVTVGRLLANVVAVFIIGLGVVAALNQVGVAGFVTSSVLTAVLATIAGILVVGVGGGLVRPMQERWGRWLALIEEESRRAGPAGPAGAPPGGGPEPGAPRGTL